MGDQDYKLFVKKIKDATAIDLADYKEAQMKRRLTSLRDKRGFDTFAAYFDEIVKNKPLFYEFLDRMTINVSEFWRNPTRWQVVEQKFIPEMLKKTRTLKCWSAACSTGEEPYSLAMILTELGATSSQILATDIDENALEKAKAGVYSERSLKDVPPHYVKKYFSKDQFAYQVDLKLKSMIRFEKGNLLVDRFERNFDLIICRNVMIYFTDSAKAMLYHKFAQALKPGGILFVGSTEQIFSPEKYGLETADTFFYRKVGL